MNFIAILLHFVNVLFLCLYFFFSYKNYINLDAYTLYLLQLFLFSFRLIVLHKLTMQKIH